MAGVGEDRAQALHRQGEGYARHLGVKPGTPRHRKIVYGTKRRGGWQPSREDSPEARQKQRRTPIANAFNRRR